MPSNYEDNHIPSGTETWLRGPLTDMSFLLTPAAGLESAMLAHMLAHVLLFSANYFGAYD